MTSFEGKCMFVLLTEHFLDKVFRLDEVVELPVVEHYFHFHSIIGANIATKQWP